MGCIILLFLIIIELIFCIWNVASSNFHVKEKDIANIAVFLVFILLNIAKIVEWNFKYYIIALVFLIQYLVAVIRIYKETENSQNILVQIQFEMILSKSIWKLISKSILYVAALVWAIL